ncbi:MAG: PorP/SprF family type IX secretion system membrane protein [Paludibacteraceae bacterium]|nr:PorP/SprF family type IX secretion system membrane protein [Paludibacteraceae bacterium]
MKTRFLALCVVLFTAISAFAQRDLMLSQQFFSRLNFNPAATGNTDDIDFFLIGRWQWANVENSPKDGVFNVSNYIESVRSGFGLTASYDDLGIANRTLIIKPAYAYHVNLNESMLLSMGLSFGFLYHSWDPKDHRIIDPEEAGLPSFPADPQKKARPDMDFGMELSTPKLLLGASISHLLNNEEDVTTSVPGRQFYLYARANMWVSDNLNICPAIVFAHRNHINKVELNCQAFFNRMIWGGVTYRPDVGSGAWFHSNDLTFTAGVEINKFRFGYAFNLGMGDIAKLSKQSHELLLSLRVPKTKKKYARFLEDDSIY